MKTYKVKVRNGETEWWETIEAKNNDHLYDYRRRGLGRSELAQIPFHTSNSNSGGLNERQARELEQRIRPPGKIGCGGHETPFISNNKWWLYMWNSIEKNHYYYCFDDDLFTKELEY